VTSIGESAFGGCAGKNTIPYSVTSIGIRAFYKCTGLRYIIIPESVEITKDTFPDTTRVIRI